MGKIHTRIKRKMKSALIRGRNRKTRPKTFKTEEIAKRYAESKGLENYKLVNLHSVDGKVKKIRVVEE